MPGSGLSEGAVGGSGEMQGLWIYILCTPTQGTDEDSSRSEQRLPTTQAGMAHRPAGKGPESVLSANYGDANTPKILDLRPPMH